MSKAQAAGPLEVFSAARMRRFVARMIVAAGWPQDEADLTAEHLVLSDLSGHPSHGIGMLPIYFEAIRAGRLRPANRPTVARRDGPFLVLQGNLCLGQVAAGGATAEAIAIAREHGIAVVNLLDAHHIGRIGHYGEQGAAAGLVGLFWVNVHGIMPKVAPYGGREGRFATNPHCVAIPRRGRQPFLLDFATSEVAFGKVRVAHARGEQVRHGALVDGEGRLSGDPEVMFREPRGALLPFGLHKGYGLALACEVLSSLLAPGRSVAANHDDTVIHNNMLAILVDPARLGGADGLAGEEERLFAWVTGAPLAEASEEILVPGDPEFRARAEAGDRFEIEPATWHEIVTAARYAGLDDSDIPRPA